MTREAKCYRVRNEKTSTGMNFTATSHAQPLLLQTGLQCAALYKGRTITSVVLRKAASKLYVLQLRQTEHCGRWLAGALSNLNGVPHGLFPDLTDVMTEY